MNELYTTLVAGRLYELQYSKNFWRFPRPVPPEDEPITIPSKTLVVLLQDMGWNGNGFKLKVLWGDRVGLVLITRDCALEVKEIQGN